MYVPPHNRNDDPAQLVEFMRQHNFASLVTATAGIPCATHLPIEVRKEGEQVCLYAHLARANPQAQKLLPGTRALVIFQGPHAYVSPAHYERQPSVPTWNYAAIHASGVVHRRDSPADKLAILERLVGVHDRPYLETLRQLPTAYLESKLQAIVAFEIEVEQLEARWKLSQDRSAAERAAIASALESSADSITLALATMMRQSETRT
jgi:transcriptional regulator